MDVDALVRTRDHMAPRGRTAHEGQPRAPYLVGAPAPVGSRSVGQRKWSRWSSATAGSSLRSTARAKTAESDRRGVLLARDGFGIKPLYYRRHPAVRLLLGEGVPGRRWPDVEPAPAGSAGASRAWERYGRSLAPREPSAEGQNSPLQSNHELCTEMYTAAGGRSLNDRK